MIENLSHITFIVSDLEKSKHLFEFVFGAKEIYSSDKKEYSISSEKFFDLNGLWIVLMQGEPLKDKTYNHLAFKISEQDLPLLSAKVSQLALEVLPSRPRIKEEGQSLYFYDYDNHLFELHTGTLKTRLNAYRNA